MSKRYEHLHYCEYRDTETGLIASNYVDVMNEQDQKIKDLEHQLSNCIEPKFKLNQEVYAFFTKEEIYKGQIDAFDYYTNTYLIFPNEDIGNEWIPAHLVFKTKKEAKAKLRGIMKSE